jgi:YegS/Rv2252/BmrU family lipid kinase
MQASELRKVLVLINPRSGFMWSIDAVQQAIAAHWDSGDRNVMFQFTQGVDDGRRKAARAVADKVDLVLVVGGDGTLNTIGRELVGSDVCLGTIPAGSGNGLARHFGIPLSAVEAARTLATGRVERIDVGRIEGRPFFITCSIAWDAAIVRTFDRMPVRGILPYIFAGAYELFEYRSQPVTLKLDDGETLHIDDPLVCTMANLTQYGGGAVIAPQAQPDDGFLDLVVARQQHVPQLIAGIGKFLAGAVTDIPQVIYRRFRHLSIVRPSAAAAQIDGELVDFPAELHVDVAPRALNMLVPSAPLVPGA